MVLHGVRADTGPQGIGSGRSPHAAAGTSRVWPSGELCVCCTAAIKAELPPAKLALPFPLREFQFGLREAYSIFGKPALR